MWHKKSKITKHATSTSINLQNVLKYYEEKIKIWQENKKKKNLDIQVTSSCV